MITIIKQLWREEVLSYRYGKEFSIAILVAGVLFGGYQGYAWHKYKKEQAAQYTLSEAIDELDKAMYYFMNKKDRNVEVAQQYLTDAQLMFDVMHSSHKGTTLEAYAYGFESEIALRKGDIDGALAILDQGIAKLSHKDPLYGFMCVKRVLIALDHGKKVDEALEFLEKMAANTKDFASDTAAFYLGYYYLTHDKKEDAIRVWTHLKVNAESNKSKSAQSPWLFFVTEKLKQLTV